MLPALTYAIFVPSGDHAGSVPVALPSAAGVAGDDGAGLDRAPEREGELRAVGGPRGIDGAGDEGSARVAAEEDVPAPDERDVAVRAAARRAQRAAAERHEDEEQHRGHGRPEPATAEAVLGVCLAQ